jgi:Big-like domain-containing protein
VPESTWNSTCTNNIFVVFAYGATPEASCNNSQAINFVETVGGGGGKSNCITSSDGTASGCSGGYAKPAWQSAPGVPADGARDLPDVSLFASSGFMGSAYIVCEADQTQSHGTCGLTNIDYDFLGIGGTSVSAPSFAGIMAMVNQYTGSAGQGNANYVFYKLASSSAQTGTNCNSSLIPAGSCIFNDVTSGTIATPCAAKSLDCNLSTASDAYGVLSGYNAGAGYDVATGLGSVNTFNLVHDWPSAGLSTATTLSLNSGNPVNITHGQSVSFNVSVSPTAATGNVSLIAIQGTANGQVSTSILTNGVASGTTNMLPGGTAYSVKAHYQGDATYGASDSNLVPVAVNPETSETTFHVVTFNAQNGQVTNSNATNFVYGSSLYFLRADVTNSSGADCFNSNNSSSSYSCPTGTVTLTDNGNPTGLGALQLNSEGFIENQAFQLTVGTHNLAASYSGDNSYLASSSANSVTLMIAPTTLSAGVSGSPVPYGVLDEIVAQLQTSSVGAEPGGTFSFLLDGVPLTVSGLSTEGFPYQPNNSATAFAYLDGMASAAFLTLGNHTLTAQYSGDGKYAPATSPAVTFNVAQALPGFSTYGASPATTNVNQQVTLVATLAGSDAGVAPTGVMTFYDGNTPLTGTVTYTSNPPTTLTLSSLSGSVPYTPTIPGSHNIFVKYSGDVNYLPVATPIAATLTVIGPDFSLSAPSNPPTVNIGTPGGSGTAALTVTSVDGFNGTVNLSVSCPGAPAEISCGVSPTSVTVNGTTTSVSATLTVTTTAATSLIQGGKPDRNGWRGNEVAAIAILCVLVLIPVSRRPKLGRWKVALGLLALGSTLTWVGCGGGSGGGVSAVANPGTPQGTYTVGVTATSGILSHSTSVTVTIF